MDTKQCAKCGSSKVIPEISLDDQGTGSDGQARLTVYSHPDAAIFRGTQRVYVQGEVCCECGHLELKCVGDLQAFWDAWIEGRKAS